MKRGIFWGILFSLFAVIFGGALSVSAVDCTNVKAQPLNVTLQPAGKRLDLKPGQKVTGQFTVKNAGCNAYDFNVKAQAFYPEESSVTATQAKNSKYTQLSRYISFNQSAYHLEPGEQAVVDYNIAVPTSSKISGGGQYAAIAIAASEKNSASVRSIQEVLYQIYARMEGKEVEKFELTNQQIDWFNVGNTISSSYKVKNTGNIDVNAIGSIEVKGLFGNIAYATPAKEKTNVAVFPESESSRQKVVWSNARPGFYTVRQTVSLNGKTFQTAHWTFLMPIWQLILLIITIIVLLAAWFQSKQKTVKTKKYDKISPFPW